MKINLLNLDNIKKGRSLYMGLAIIWVILFHYDFLIGTPLHCIISKGYLGVDIFILLSSFGLCFSLKKNSSYKDYIVRRFKRIVPTWWILITFTFVVNVIIQRDHPHTLFQFICYYSGIGWWFFCSEPHGIYYYEWYIPALLLFYLFTPFLYKLSNKKIIILFILSIVCSILLRELDFLAPELRFAYQRIPTFIYGVILYKMYSGQIDINLSRKYLSLSSIIGLVVFLYVLNSPKFSCMIIHSFMFTIPLLLNICYMLIRGKMNTIISFIGTLTLELYILHMYHLPLTPVRLIIKDKDLSIIVATFVVIGAAYIVNIVVSKGLNLLTKKSAGDIT